jgi:DNA-binding NarL/FixJ family response regulator
MQKHQFISVFIADDSLVVQERLVALLSELDGVEIIGLAQTAPTAIAGVQELRPDVVLLDIQMPGGNGIEVLQAIKGAQIVPVVIMLTNYPFQAYRLKCLQLGADFFFDKSTEFDRIPGVLAGLQHGSVAVAKP